MTSSKIWWRHTKNFTCIWISSWMLCSILINIEIEHLYTWHHQSHDVIHRWCHKRMTRLKKGLFWWLICHVYIMLVTDCTRETTESSTNIHTMFSYESKHITNKWVRVKQSQVSHLWGIHIFGYCLGKKNRNSFLGKFHSELTCKLLKLFTTTKNMIHQTRNIPLHNSANGTHFGEITR